jgi:proteic killer suppression protein
VIKSFKDKETEKIYHRRFSKKYSPDIQRIALRKLRMLNNSQNLQDLRSPPGNRLEKPRGARAGQYSIGINDPWKICFVWRAGDAFEADIADYH